MKRIWLEEIKIAESLLDNSSDMEFKLVLESNQLSQIKKRLDAIGKISDEDAIKLLDFDSEKEFRKYLFYTSADYIQNLALPEYKDLLEIVFMEDEEKQVIAFNRYISNTENLKLLQNIFPIICTTCISAHKLGGAEPIFDMTIIDEASQCPASAACRFNDSLTSRTMSIRSSSAVSVRTLPDANDSLIVSSR